MNEIWLINGIPGVGKSTTARALAERYDRAVHIEGDRLQEIIVSGAVGPGQSPPEEEARQIRLNVRNQCLLAQSFLREGFTPVIDYVVVSRARVETYRQQLQGSVLRLATLAPGVEVALQRDRERPEKTVAPQWAHLEEQIRAELKSVGLWIDNRSLTVQETVDQILLHREAAAV